MPDIFGGAPATTPAPSPPQQPAPPVVPSTGGAVLPPGMVTPSQPAPTGAQGLFGGTTDAIGNMWQAVFGKSPDLSADMTPPPLVPEQAAAAPKAAAPSGLAGAASSLGGTLAGIGGQLAQVAGAGLSALPLTALNGSVAGTIAQGAGITPTAAQQEFDQLGQWMKVNDPTNYPKWAAVNASAGQGILGQFAAPNTYSDFNNAWKSYYANLTKEGPQGVAALNPQLTAAPGSVGGLLSDALQLGLNTPMLAMQRTISGLSGIDINPLDNPVVAGSNPVLMGVKAALNATGNQSAVNPVTQGDRVTQVLAKATSDPTALTQPEKTVVAMVSSGQWTKAHALDYLTSHNAGYSDNMLEQTLGMAVNDPVQWASLGTSGLLKLGEIGTVAAESGLDAKSLSNIDRLGMVVKGVQEDPHLAPIAKAARMVIDPIGAVAGKSSVSRGIADMTGDLGTEALRRTYGEPAIHSAQGLAGDLGISDEVNQLAGDYAANKMREWGVIQTRQSMLRRGGISAESLNDPTLNMDSVAADYLKSASKDAPTRATEYMTRNQQVVVPQEQLASRLAHAFPGTMDEPGWAAEVQKMSPDELSFWHAISYTAADETLIKAKTLVSAAEAAASKTPIDRLELLNDNRLDNIAAQNVIKAVKQPLLDAQEAARAAGITDLSKVSAIKAQAAAWNKAVDYYPALLDIGHKPPNEGAVQDAIDELTNMLPGLHQRITPDQFSKLPQSIRDAMGALGDDWNLGFAPTDAQRMGLARDAQGRLYASWNPFLSHVANGVGAPLARPASETARNFLGQSVPGRAIAGVLSHPLDEMEIMARTGQDEVTGARMMMNYQQRLVRNLSKYGIGQGTTNEIWRGIQGLAKIKSAPLNALKTGDVWQAVKDMIPVDEHGMQLIKPRDMELELLDACNGDMRIVGYSSNVAQRFRTALAGHPALGTGDNIVGEITSEGYQRLRYNYNPTFQTQVRNDPVMFGLMHGITPVGNGVPAADSALARMNEVSRNIGETSVAADFSLERPEYQSLIDSSHAIQSGLSKIPNSARVIRNASESGSRFVRNNLVNILMHSAGDIVKSTFEDVAKATGDDTLLKSFANWRASFSEISGRPLSDIETGIKYMENKVTDMRHGVPLPDGTLDFSKLVREADQYTPASIGEIKALNLPELAHEFGFMDVTAWRKAIGANGVSGLADLRETAAEQFQMAPDFVDRLVSALTTNHNTVMSNLKANYDLSTAEADRLENMLAQQATLKGMTPAEYESQILASNITSGDLESYWGKVLAVIRTTEGPNAAGAQARVAALANIFGEHLDPSAQLALVDRFQAELPTAIAETMAEGATQESQGMQHVLESLRGGWTQDTSRSFARAVGQAADSGVQSLDPDVARAVEYFKKWLVASDIGTPSGANRLAGRYVTELLKNIPTDQAFAYNYTEGMIAAALKDRFSLAAKDAFRLAYAQTSRTVFERSINHPILGIYPSSYMWFKVFPEMVKFLAKEPFGLQGIEAGLETERIEQSIASQREYDPKFQTFMDGVDKSAVSFLLSYLTPSLPWDEYSGNLPKWFTDAAAGVGKDPVTTFGKMTTDTLGLMDPARWVKYFGSAGTAAVRMAQHVLGTAPQQHTAPPAVLPPGMNTPASTATPAVPAPVAPAAPAAPTSDNLKQPVQGEGLVPVLEDQVGQLRNMLSRSM